MSTTVPPLSQDVLPALRRGDVDALERLFREQYAPLRDEASEELRDESGYAATVSPIVERAFVAAWTRREQFESSGALTAYLHDGVHRGVVRERGRRAAVRRFEAHEGVPARASALSARAASVDDAWSRVAAALHGADPERDAAAHVAAGEVRRHAAAEHLAGLARRRPWMTRVLAPALLLAVSGGAAWWMGALGKAAAVDRALAATDARVISAKPGQRAAIALADGSRLMLGAGSQLRIPARFGDDVRAVALDGAATVTVAAGRELPLELRAGRAAAVASAGTFVVRAYGDEATVTVGVREGEVTVKAGDDSRVLSTGDALTVTADGVLREPTTAAREEALGWADGRFVVVGRPVRDVLPQLKRWYATDLRVPDPALLDRVVTMSASLDSTRSALTALASSVGAWAGFEGKVLVLRDAADPPAPVPARARRTP
jgi:ferric-dicitrate binding protein FerR (iron transport regulator)